jgi:hypothetical protein
MAHIKYQHLEKLGTAEVQDIELGECFVFPKIDGTNASVWAEDGEMQCGSRTRLLDADNDNAGFYAWATQQNNLKEFLTAHPTLRLYGEWLVPHSLKTYKETAWRNFYVFDVATEKQKAHEGDHPLTYLHYNEYKPLLEKHSISYIHPIAVIKNGSYQQFINQLANNVYLIEDGAGTGEGIVLKNYAFVNKYGRTTWAKVVTSEFKEKHAKEMGPHVLNGTKLVEEEIADKYITQALCEKEHAKICADSDGWHSKLIPRLLHTIFYSVVKEEAWEFVKEHKNPTIDFKRLQHFVFAQVKEKMPQVF